ncbi:uncharacterized protein SCHCODRAFT_02689100 [Schizophyllum commune H4-8]|uniref:uncharacterized protein n=1 Tax=Schizophyllum commune (strain H4-8 / FGSC 9210) TaxID=578458 RepID=UPI00216084C6|nr:uncharacterized protein SCHCODRAFT_02689100 [Schizophyllum commune H4-8]KAI5892821.1 hypothetical protein SCHCODRAFT_02689100 [Schizophyllum commune H4-8]
MSTQEAPAVRHMQLFVCVDEGVSADPFLEPKPGCGLPPPTISYKSPRMSGNVRLSYVLSSLKASRSSRLLLSADLHECVLGNIAPSSSQEETIRRLIKATQNQLQSIGQSTANAPHEKNILAAFRLAHVCRQWRGDARFWTRLRLAGNQACGAEALLQVGAWFERARALHVSLTVVCTDEGCEPGSEHLLMEPRFGDLGP